MNLPRGHRNRARVSASLKPQRTYDRNRSVAVWYQDRFRVDARWRADLAVTPFFSSQSLIARRICSLSSTPSRSRTVPLNRRHNLVVILLENLLGASRNLRVPQSRRSSPIRGTDMSTALPKSAVEQFLGALLIAIVVWLSVGWLRTTFTRTTQPTDPPLPRAVAAGAAS